MATSPDDKTMSNTFRRYKEGDDTWGNMAEHIFQEDTSYKCPTYIQKTPPCQGGCPAGEDIRGWLQIVRGIEKPLGFEAIDKSLSKEEKAEMTQAQMQEYAFRRSTDANPFPSMMGRVCPAPCQDSCNRNDVDDFVGINAIEQYIGDTAIENGYSFDNSATLTGKKIAIIGGGPAGMAAAYQLRRMGHASTIFDDHDKLGGMMRYGIPNYRTPRKHLNAECDRILAMGDIEFKANTRVGRDISVADVEAEYDAVLWALGCKKGRGLFLDNWNDVPNCVTAVDFLEQFNKGEMKYTASKIVCVGGGDTSIDVVSVSRRIGTLTNYTEKPEDSAEGRIVHDDVADADRTSCDNVVLTALFKEEEMTATDHEVEDAKREGVVLMNEVMPVEIITDENGRATALKLVECKFEGNMPVAIEGGKETIVEADLIVSAIGQFGDLDGVEEYGNDRGLMDADKFYQVPGKEGHFVAGDIIRPHLLTTAIGQGSIAAETINDYLKQEKMEKRPKVDKHHFEILENLAMVGHSPEGEEAEDLRGTDTLAFAVHNYDDRSEHEIVESSELFLGHFEAVARNIRGEDAPSAAEVLGHFNERLVGMNNDVARDEADRCMSCGMCFECDNCVIYCPQDAVFKVPPAKSSTGRYVATDYDKCVGCHVCADVCPTGYIEMGLGG
ncbi:MAG: FAD-dependent oxidoreductase [Thiotrichaceae bacterium]|nr:FAD-dependent oxidoreductase [Thiotrichaceae bacterium]